VSNDSNAYTNPKTLTTLALTLTDPDDAFDSFFVLVFCDLVTELFLHRRSAVVTSKTKNPCSLPEEN